MTNKSEVARLTAQIESEYQAAHAALYSMAAGTARHDFITARMEHLETARVELVEQIGEQSAMPLIIAALEGEISSRP